MAVTKLKPKLSPIERLGWIEVKTKDGKTARFSPRAAVSVVGTVAPRVTLDVGEALELGPEHTGEEILERIADLIAEE